MLFHFWLVLQSKFHVFQDLYVDRLTQDVDKIEQQIALTHAQCLAQAQETKAMKELLAEATMELEVLIRHNVTFHMYTSLLGSVFGEEKTNASMEQQPDWYEEKR